MRHLFHVLLLVTFTMFLTSCNKETVDSGSVTDIRFEPLNKYINHAPTRLIHDLDRIFTKQPMITLEPECIEDHLLMTDNDYWSFLANYEKPIGYFDNNRCYNFKFTHFSDVFLFDSSLDTNFYHLENIYINELYKRYNKSIIENSIVERNISAAYYSRSIISESDWSFTKSYGLGREKWHLPTSMSRKGINAMLASPNFSSHHDSIIDAIKTSDIDIRGSLEVSNCYVHSMSINKSLMSSVLFDNTVVNQLSIVQDSIEDFTIRNNPDHSDQLLHQHNTLFIDDSNIGIARIDYHFKKVIIKDVSAEKIEFLEEPDTLLIIGGNIENIRIVQSKKERYSQYAFDDFVFDNIDLTWENNSIYRPDSTWTNDQISSMYLGLLGKFQNVGYETSLEKLDIDYQQWKYDLDNRHILSWIEKNWWNYGYDKSLIIWNMLLFYFVFSLLNIFILKRLCCEMYLNPSILSVIKSNEKSPMSINNYSKRLIPSLFYTAQIYFGLRFNIEKLLYEDKMDNYKVFYLFYFMIIFLSGIVCVAFVLNVIIS